MKALHKLAADLRTLAEHATHPDFTLDPMEARNLADRADALAEMILLGITDEQMAVTK